MKFQDNVRARDLKLFLCYRLKKKYDIGTNVPEARPTHMISVASNVVSLPQIVNYSVISDLLKI
jgi:hypothetical protein